MGWPIGEYLAERVSRGRLVPSSAVVVRNVLQSFERSAGCAPQQVTEAMLHRWLVGGEPAPATIKSRLTKARPFWQWMARNGLVERDITASMETPRIPEGLPRCLDPADVARVLDACPDARARVVVTLMVQLGLRVGEVARITSADVDYRRGTLLVRGKGGRGLVTRSVPITNACWPALEAVGAGERGWTGPLVRSLHDTRAPVSPHYLSKLVSRWFSEAGVKLAPGDGMSSHALRHTAAQDVLDDGAATRIVQKMLGHKSVATTEIYLRREPPGLREAMEGRSYGRRDELAARRFERHNGAAGATG